MVQKCGKQVLYGFAGPECVCLRYCSGVIPNFRRKRELK